MTENKSLICRLASCQDLVPIQFQSSPVLVATGNNAVFTLQTISSIFSIAWIAPGGGTLGQWINNQAVLNPIAQYQGRVSISATQLTISSSQLSDAGIYMVTVTPLASTGLATNSRSVTLSVFVAVGAVNLVVPSLAIEGGNASLTCSWTSGTNTSVIWGKGSTNLPSDPRFVVNAGSLVISPVNRNDAGQYSCTVSNPVSSQTATASLTVYYGPDTPQVTRTSSNCVGGGEATIGQTVQLTCTSVSLPPALLSWQLNGVPLTSSQANSGTLNLQIFSTNQSGQYTCSASNSITIQTSQQQISLSVVSTCLSVGAVAGIVVACFVALVLIIVAIILIIRQRKADQRLRTVIGQQKHNLNERPTVLSAPQDGLDNRGFVSQADQPDPPVHNDNRLVRSKNQPTNDQQNNYNINMQTQNRATNTSAILSNGHLNADTFSHNANLHSSARLHDSQRNSDSNRRNADLSPQEGQQNPNILIQTGNTALGPHTVLINLSTLPQHQNATTQPQTVQVSLNAPQPLVPSGQPNQNTAHSNDQQTNTIQPERAKASHSNLHHVRGSRSSPQTRMDNVGNLAQPSHSSTTRNGQRRDQQVTNQTRSRRNTEETYPNEPTHRQSGRSLDSSDANTHPRQMPWDRMHGTPAYPNPQMDSSESENSTGESSSSQSVSQHSAPALRPARSPVDERVRNISRSSRRNFLRQLAHSAAQTRARADRSASTQIVQPNLIPEPRPDRLSRIPPQTITSQRHVPESAHVSVPQNQAVQMQAVQPTNLNNQAGPNQRQTAVHSNFRMLTQAALQQHNIQNQQTQAALGHPGAQSTPAQTLPALPINRAGQAAPVPPPVLRPEEFKTLPPARLPKPHAVMPVQVKRRPVGMHHGHRPHNVPMHARATHHNLHPANPHMHPNAQWQGKTQRNLKSQCGLCKRRLGKWMTHFYSLPRHSKERKDVSSLDEQLLGNDSNENVDVERF
ncbi:hypothetical protein C0J50_0636 [Silurus asotus]|uniref:Ig-like domain-containing protein n=1 Tax=Silurus asotus TaxID=30991 RepID=A0AAD5FDH7_SILAS|nr:hypothetical protein C0J50_0636 [Silurus asotus]